MDPDICDLDTWQSDVETYLSDVKSPPESESGTKILSADLSVSLNGLNLYMFWKTEDKSTTAENQENDRRTCHVPGDRELHYQSCSA